MEDGRGTGSVTWKSAMLTLCFVSSLLLQVAECNYAALYNYDRNLYVDMQDSFVLDNFKTVTLPRTINYYGQQYSTLHVSKDGTVGFGNNGLVTYKRHPQWPRGFTELTSVSDKPFIAPFHHEGYTSQVSPQRYTGRIYSHYYMRHEGEFIRSVEDKEHTDFLDYLGKYLSHSSITIDTFTPDLYVIITWENVTDQNTVENNDSCDATEVRPCPSATFQLVLAADARNTFAIFNYAKMDIPYTESQIAGMNGGMGRGWTDVVKCGRACSKLKHSRDLLATLPNLQGSSTRDIHLVTDRSSDEVMGRFLFVVTDYVIVRGGCLPRDNRMGYLDTVEVFPPQVEMLGGQIIKVTGPCQAPYTPVYCRFDQQAVTEGKTTAGMVGWCPVPRLTSRGHVRLEVSSDGSDWKMYTFIIVIPPNHLGQWSEDMTMQPWFQINPKELRLTWNATQLTQDSAATVDIVLVQYKETANQVQWQELVTLAEEIQNTGTFRFDPQREDYSQYRYTCQENCDGIDLGVVEVRLSREHLELATERQYIAKGPLPLGWYVHRVNSDYNGYDWPRYKCEQWAAEERQHKHWMMELPSCPCSLQQALADWGRWQADTDCSMFRKGSKCAFNRGAKHCVRSVQPTTSATGSHCCYDNDNNLMYSGDSYEGSTSSRAHAWGASPYQTAGTVPTMSHWLKDLIPYYQCCRWTDNEYCQLYTDNRPTKDCRTYDPPGSAIIYGDPHVTTFDDESYHFGGAGDFWLVNSKYVMVQARFMERQSSTVIHKDGYLSPTRISSLVVKGDTNSDTVTFSIAPAGDLHPRRLDVKIFDRHFFFDTELNMWQDFRSFSIVNNMMHADSQDDREHSNFTVLLTSGAGVQVAERHGLLHVVVVLPPYDKDERNPNQEPASKGLLGSWDERRVNEYMGPDGHYFPSKDATEELKYQDFALKWAVKGEDQSLFQFNHPADTRRPHTGRLSDFLNPENRPSDGLVAAECGQAVQDYSNPCAHDYYVTGNRTVAIDTRRAQEAFESLRRSQRKMWSCGWLNIPFAVKDHTNYSAGNTLRVTGCRSGLGSTGSVDGGPDQYTCIQNETDHQPFWDPNEVYYYLCIDAAEGANIGMIIGIVAAVVVVIIVVVVLAIILYRRKKSGKKSVPKPKATAREDAEMDRGTDETLLKRQPAPRNIYKMQDVKKPEPQSLSV
ncbi:sushi domain-containing protein 2-like [Littorina saxatilis]|uniref:Protein mesh n=1 Tax=Littorina saxatilis TaxID=31220 RepID=A0AAN9B2G2_9CAEN